MFKSHLSGSSERGEHGGNLMIHHDNFGRGQVDTLAFLRVAVKSLMLHGQPYRMARFHAKM